MADTKISALPAVSAVADANEVPINEAGTSKKFSITQLKAFLAENLFGVVDGNQQINATTALVNGCKIAVPTGKLRVGTRFKWRIAVDKTAAGTTTGCTFDIKVGTAGTTADTTIATPITLGTPTAVADQAWLEIDAVVRSIGATCTIEWAARFMHDSNGATGFDNQANPRIKSGTATTFDSTVAGLFVELSITTTTGSVWTVRAGGVEVFNL